MSPMVSKCLFTGDLLESGSVDTDLSLEARLTRDDPPPFRGGCRRRGEPSQLVEVSGH